MGVGTDPGAVVPQQGGPPAEAWLQAEGPDARRWALVETATVGRSPAADVVLDDPHVSRIHARLERVGDTWTLLDDGLSRNGTWHNGRRVQGRTQLHDRDRLGIGESVLVFCAPAQLREEVTLVAAPLLALAVARLTPAQRAVLSALARPCREDAWALPATNAQIAEQLFLSLDAVKTHLRLLFAKFGIDALPQNAKRVRLVELALQAGLVDDAERV